MKRRAFFFTSSGLLIMLFAVMSYPLTAASGSAEPVFLSEQPGLLEKHQFTPLLEEQPDSINPPRQSKAGGTIRHYSSTEPPAATRDLTSGVPKSFSIGPVASPTLMNIDAAFRIHVPPDATRLSVQVTTTTPGADLDLFVRWGAAPEIATGGGVVSDHSRSTASGNESLEVTRDSNPALREGTYFITLGLFTANIVVRGTVTATIVTVPDGNGGGGAAVVLAPAVPASFSLPAVTTPTLMSMSGAFQVTVPANAASLEVQVVTATPGADVDLFVRFGTPPEVADGRVMADFRSTTTSGNETVLIRPSSSPPLRPGVYFITLGLTTTNMAVTGTITARLGTESTLVNLTSGGPASISLPAVTSNTLMTTNGTYRITVPATATMLVVTTTINQAATMDLFVRFGEPPDLSNGFVVADHRSTTDGTGNQRIVVDRNSSPALRAGDYYITLGVRTGDVAITGTITATWTVSRPAVIYNGAGYQRNFVSPGVIATIAASGIATGFDGCVVPDWSFGPLPLTLADVSVTMDGRPAPIFSVCNIGGEETVTVQVPFELVAGRSVSIQGTTPGGGFSIDSIRIQEVSPGIFTTTRTDGVSQAVILRSDNSYASPVNPVAPGETVRAYVTGLGPLVPMPATNTPGSEDVDSAVLHPVVVGVNNAGVPVIQAKYAVNLIGVWEVTFTVPFGMPSGDLNFAVAVNLNGELIFGNGSIIPVR